ncbi:PREDICTED: uncharacterized protein LOC104772024 isoform X2 [Camelina sativa]|uniref:Uncharacterized protein LOC104772024 isoform X2 n=1 Tax=Camelina sativa TaxID=90675 RepID=A0ABM0Y3R5_CAMSA|nr:PREDICTED: uncharacterized protein LOC104772024 isoform X2 [Camelina sativa]
MGRLDFTKDDKEQRKNRDSWHCPDSHKHIRSKSASSERDLHVSSNGASQSAENFTRIQTKSSVQTRANKIPKPLQNRQVFIKNNVSSTDRASLERDVEQLHLRLQQEKSMRMVLERAMGRASSSLSPGHRHFAGQAKELITEIELLEAEVANREHHVLSLYRSIFEQTVSRASSEQSSVISSPAHQIKQQPPKRHPSVISNAFCSSMSFPTKPWHALVAFKDTSRKTYKGDQSSQFQNKDCISSTTSCSSQAKSHSKDSVTEKSPSQRTLKDHLYQCPNKLSEDMVKCMASVYFWLCSSAMSADPEKRRRSPTLSRSSTSNVIIPKNIMNEDRAWSCRSMVEVSWISSDKRRFSQASYAINNYRLLVEQLERVSINQMEGNAKLAFWINIYNALLMHAYLAYGVPANSLRRLALFHKSAYNIGGQIINANTIEYSIFRFQTPRNGRWLETIISTALRKKPAEDKVSSMFSLHKPEPLLCFALCTGALSDPVLKAYTASNVKEELEASKREFLGANVIVKMQKKVLLPKIIERFTKEALLSSDDLMRWLIDNADEKLGESIQKCVQGKPNNKKSSQVVEWLAYSSRFRYVFSKDLMEKKPWWV